MQNGWIKFHRKTLHNEIFRNDPTAWRVFEVLLLLCDYKTRSWSGGRFQLTKWCGINPRTQKEYDESTVRSALKRLRKASMIEQTDTTSKSKKFSTYLISKWDDYQSFDGDTVTTNVPTNDTTSVPTNVPTLQEDNNKEVKNTEVAAGAATSDLAIATLPSDVAEFIARQNPEIQLALATFAEYRLAGGNKGGEKRVTVRIMETTMRDLERFHHGAPDLMKLSIYQSMERKWTGVQRASRTPEVAEMYQYWLETTGLDIESWLPQNDEACFRLIESWGEPKLKQYVRAAAAAQEDRYAPRIKDFCSLRDRADDLKVWAKQRENRGGKKAGRMLPSD